MKKVNVQNEQKSMRCLLKVNSGHLREDWNTRIFFSLLSVLKKLRPINGHHFNILENEVCLADGE